MSLIASAKAWARDIKRDILALWIAARDPRTLMAAMVAAYALSPIDLIPDFVPILGYLDDLLIVPLGIVISVRLIPKELMAEFRAEAAGLANRPTSFAGMMVIAGLWIAAAFTMVWVFWLRGG